jgi:hypothetical protein
VRTYEIQLRKEDGSPNCSLFVLFAYDQSAIILGKYTFKMNRERAERVIVSCVDRVIFEDCVN